MAEAEQRHLDDEEARDAIDHLHATAYEAIHKVRQILTEAQAPNELRANNLRQFAYTVLQTLSSEAIGVRDNLPSVPPEPPRK